VTEHTIVLFGVNDDGSCRCGDSSCLPKNRGKHPKCAPHEPGDNVGNLTGETHGRIAVDIDVRHGDGFGELIAFPGCAEWLKHAKTYSVATASGGAHLYFQHPGFHVGNGKLSPNIDVRGDAEGWAYVLAPGSRVVLDDGTVGVHRVDEDVAVAPCPDWLLAALLARGTKKTTGYAPTPIDPTHPDWDRRVELAIEACTTLPPSKADGEGGKRLFAVCLRLVREYELPLDAAHELIEEFFNPRCTTPDGEPYPWSPEDIQHKLEDARDRSDSITGMLPRKAIERIKEITNRNRTPRPAEVAPGTPKQRVGAKHAYDGERAKITRAALTQMLYNWPDWEGVFWYDVLARKPRATDPPLEGRLTLENGEMSKGDLALIAHWLDVKGFLASKEQIEDALWTVVRSPDRQRNVIADYLDSLPLVAAAPTLATLATDVLGCTDPFANTLVQKTLVAACRRARNPGAFHKSMLVLKGEQGTGKTPFVKILAGAFYHSTGNGNLADRDTILECQGKWLVEVEELSALGKADENALKTAVSRTHDVITKKYEPDGQSYPRSFVLVGTTNKDAFLTDSTGNPRYWVIETGKIDLARLEQMRDTLWAEADFLARSGASNELTSDEAEHLEGANKAFTVVHPWIDEVRKYLGGKKEVASATQVLMHVLKNDLTKADKRALNEVGDIMRTLGCKNVVRKRDGKVSRVWTVPDTLPAQASSVVRLVVPKK